MAFKSLRTSTEFRESLARQMACKRTILSAASNRRNAIRITSLWEVDDIRSSDIGIKWFEASPWVRWYINLSQKTFFVCPDIVSFDLQPFNDTLWMKFVAITAYKVAIGLVFFEADSTYAWLDDDSTVLNEFNFFVSFIIYPYRSWVFWCRE